MPLISFLGGDRMGRGWRIGYAPLLRIPLWALVTWWTAKGIWRCAVFVVRSWRVTAPLLVAWWLWRHLDWRTVLVATPLLAAAGALWWHLHPASLRLLLTDPVRAWWRRLACYRWRWTAAMTTCGLAVSFGGNRYTPHLVRVRANPVADRVTVRLLPGQTPDDYARVAPRLAYTFRVLDTRVQTTARPDRVVLVMLRRDPLAHLVAPLPVPDVADLDALALGMAEDGTVYRLRLADGHLLVAGSTGAGKGSVVWAVIAALAGGIRAGVVRLWVFDPKGGMELAAGAALFDRFCYANPAGMADTLEQAVGLMRERADRLRGHTRRHDATVADPTYVLVVDELAALTAYVTDRKTRDRIREALSLLLSQGRAVGFHVVGALQDPRKEVLPFRDLFTVRIGLRLAEAGMVDLALGDGAHQRGAACDRIPDTLPGVGYVVVDGRREPVRVRFAYHTDHDITALANRYTPPTRRTT